MPGVKGIGGALWIVTVELEGTRQDTEAGTAQVYVQPFPALDGRYQNKAVTHTGSDVGPDGRFLVIGNSSPQVEALSVILNWTEELKRLVPVN